MVSSTSWPNVTQQRALAYAPKPFAALSFLSSLYVLYDLLVRHPGKRKRMYHRLMLSTFCCILPLSVVLFWGTWAMPAESAPWAVGAVGTSATCSIQGFLYVTFTMAFPFYYASISVMANIALSNRFKEENYAWMEKWIHLGAYLLPLSVATAAIVKDWVNPGLSHCAMANPAATCESSNDIECVSKPARPLIISLTVVIMLDLLAGTIAIVYLLWRVFSIQKQVDAARGMKQIVEKARWQMYLDGSLQIGLYFISIWFGYIPSIVEAFIRLTSGHLNYELIVASDCMFAFQGTIIMVIYLVLQRRSEKVKRESLGMFQHPDRMGELSRQDTVGKIRANAAQPRRQSRKSSKFSFHIFDGTPGDDSPWADYFNSPDGSGSVFETVIENIDDSVDSLGNNLTSGLLTNEDLVDLEQT